MSGRLFAYAKNLDAPSNYGEFEEAQICSEEEANLEISISTSQHNPHVVMHKPQLDLDVPHGYRGSSTFGNGHLLIDVDVPWDLYVKWLELSAQIGIIEQGWVKAAKARGYTSLRKKGVKKKHKTSGYPEPPKVENLNDLFGVAPISKKDEKYAIAFGPL